MTSPSSSTLAAKIRENPKAFSAPPNSHLIEITYATATEKRGERVILTSHFIAVTYAGPTNTRGSRVVLTSHRFPGDRISDSYNSGTWGCYEQGLATLKTLGYTVVTSGESKAGYFVCVAEFLPLKEARAQWKAVKAHIDGRWHDAALRDAGLARGLGQEGGAA